MGYFIKNYNVDYFICPLEHTTTLDFLDLYNKHDRYDHIILHTGVVDFSPRPISKLNLLIHNKKRIYYKFFQKHSAEKHLINHYDEKYKNDEYTNSLYSLRMAKDRILPQLHHMENLIWIGCNRVIRGWDGNYPGERPINMDVIQHYNAQFLKNIDNTVDISKWTNDEIMKYTCDNIHLTKAGMDYIKKEIVKIIK